MCQLLHVAFLQVGHFKKVTQQQQDPVSRSLLANSEGKSRLVKSYSGVGIGSSGFAARSYLGPSVVWALQVVFCCFP